MSTNNIRASAYKGRYGFWRMIYIFIFAILLAGVGSTYYFIYQNIYNTIANTNAITSLKSNINIYNLDIPAFERASTAIATKQKLEYLPSNTRNIFYYITASSTVSSTPSYANTSTKP